MQSISELPEILTAAYNIELPSVTWQYDRGGRRRGVGGRLLRSGDAAVWKLLTFNAEFLPSELRAATLYDYPRVSSSMTSGTMPPTRRL
jgi:hypothetical protein